MSDKQLIAPYVRNAALPDLETSIQVADTALLYFKNLKRNYSQTPSPVACVTLAVYKHNQATTERVQKLAKLSGCSFDGFLRQVSETRALLNLPFDMSFEQIATEAKLPLRLANTANKIFRDIQASFPDDQTLSRSAIYASVMLLVAYKRGYNKNVVLEDLARITTTDQSAILDAESVVRNLIGDRYGGRKVKKDDHEDIAIEISEETKISTAKIIEQNKEEAKNKKIKKKQSTLSFAPK